MSEADRTAADARRGILAGTGMETGSGANGFGRERPSAATLKNKDPAGRSRAVLLSLTALTVIRQGVIFRPGARFRFPPLDSSPALYSRSRRATSLRIARDMNSDQVRSISCPFVAA